MQRILLSLCTGTLLLFVQPKAQAQEQPSTFKRNLIGGTVGFGYTKSETAFIDVKSTITSFNFGPTYAYYLKENVAIGASLSYYYQKATNMMEADETKNNLYYAAPFIRFEIPLWQSRFAIFNDLGIFGSYSKTTSRVDSNTTKLDGWGAGAFYEPGIMFRIKSNVALQASLGRLLAYSYSKDERSESHSFGFWALHNGTNDFKLGINFLF